ncbi:MAG: hypothetical protein ACOYOD_02205, partial [Saprospiraceae bacterium]
TPHTDKDSLHDKSTGKMGLKISFVKPKNQKNSILKSQFGLCKKPFPPDVTKKYFERALVFLICRIKSKKQVLVHYFIRQVGAAKYFSHNPQRWCPHPIIGLYLYAKISRQTLTFALDVQTDSNEYRTRIQYLARRLYRQSAALGTLLPGSVAQRGRGPV